MRYSSAAIFAAFLTLMSGPAHAEVKLSSPDGGVEITGRLLGYDGEFYRIASVYGILMVDAHGVRCEGSECPAPGPFVPEAMISGEAQTAEDIVPVLIGAFAEAEGLRILKQIEDDAHDLFVLRDTEGRDVARLRIRKTSTAEGFADLISETASAALALRPPAQSERDRAQEAQLGDISADARVSVLALDALVAVVGESSPVRHVSPEQLSRILSGHVRTWQDLGGPEAPIHLHLPEENSALAGAISDILSTDEGGPRPDAARHARMDALREAVARDPLALGIMPFTAARGVRMLALSGSCGRMVEPGSTAIKLEDYPFLLPHLLYTPDLRAPQVVRDLLAFAASEDAQLSLREAGYVDQAIEFVAFETRGDQRAQKTPGVETATASTELRRFDAHIEGARRLLLAFRFDDGEAELDRISRGNVRRLAGAIERGEIAGSTLILAGFSDGLGPQAANLDLSLRRAEAVRSALLESLPDHAIRPEILVDGFGEAVPLACDEDDWGRRINRRVEIWLR